MAKRLSQLFISYKNDPSVYVVNAKTFELENIVKAPEFSDFLPVVMMLPDNEAHTAVAISENSKVYNLASMEGLILYSYHFDFNLFLCSTQLLEGVSTLLLPVGCKPAYDLLLQWLYRRVLPIFWSDLEWRS